MEPQLAHMTRFVRALFDQLPPLRWYVGVPRKSKVVVYVDAQYSHDGRKGVGIVITHIRKHMTIHDTSQEEPSQHTSCHGLTASLPIANNASTSANSLASS